MEDLGKPISVDKSQSAWQSKCMTRTFEWDENKNQQNIKKHKLDFNEVISLFEKEYTLLKSNKNNKERFVLVAKYQAVIFVSVIYTLRLPNIRIISARRSKKKEIEVYKKEHNQF